MSHAWRNAKAAYEFCKQIVYYKKIHNSELNRFAFRELNTFRLVMES